ncbi:MAG: cation:proton antiporter [Nanoarchaeota archaeon]|nr:cation:proton antiporter [Nanoarchaeota archaeon]
MVAEFNYLTEFSWLSLLLLLGVIIAFIAKKIKFPDILLLLIIGAIFGQIGVIELDMGFLAGLGTFALVMIIFESTSRFKPREISQLSPYAIKLSVIFMGMNLFVLTIFTHLLFNGVFVWREIILSLLFAAIMSGTSPSAVLSMLAEKSSKLVELIEFESIFNTPFTVIIPLVILKLYLGVFQTVEIVAVSFLQEIMTGVGTGLVLGLVAFRSMKHIYMEKLSPLVVIAVALITYTLANYLGGNGVLAVTALGIVFGISNLKEKESLQKFVSIFTNFLKIVVFVLLGLLIKIPLEKSFLLKSLMLFLIYLFIRFASVNTTFKSSDLNFRERIFLSLNISKGVAVAVVAFVVAASITTSYIKTLLDLIFLFMFYSIVVSSFAARFHKFFLRRQTSINELKGVKKKAAESIKK